MIQCLMLLAHAILINADVQLQIMKILLLYKKLDVIHSNKFFNSKRKSLNQED